MRDKKKVWRNRTKAVTVSTVLLLMICATGLAADRTAVDTSRSSVQTIMKFPSTVRKIPRVTAPILRSVQLWDIVNGAANSSISYRRQVQLGISYSGTRPTHYRVSENRQFERASWQTFYPRGRYRYTFQRNSDGRKTVYVQLRYGDGTKYLSQVQQASIVYRKPPTISNFQIENGAASASKRQVLLTWNVSGIATDYRVSESSDMAGASWKTGGAPPSGGLIFDLAEGASGQRRIYLQVKREQSDPVSANDSINLTVGICPIGHRGLECSGAGTCSNAGQCTCNADISGPACETICQRCYGAAGNNCGVADGMNFPANLGVCMSTPQGPSCQINAGSWAHDECCVRYRFGGPNSQQGSCTVAGLGPPPYVCQLELAKAVAQLPNPLLTWTRTDVNFSKSSCTDGIEMPVTHADMCNPSGGTLLCSDVQYCCSGSGQASAIQAPAATGGILCVCD
ncbi:hypothetical protein [Candidatus Nitronereus thalassa]|uniref:EGF-like domain-containing protein n=1 Tax=Candidatus Nitronereus thalassa TaxID=3020898 RepID=A0ABU3KCI1_9BACT|nr:hypothetical protein [Candidatus Nitronereus thalassa]MDT7044103.1 hypothetical protein [Candidatus Nitronereus thalassa]